MSKLDPACILPDSFDTTPFGHELTESIAEYLIRHRVLANNHPHYCGMGLFFRDGEFLYADVCDAGLGLYGTYRTFTDRTSFVAWLAQQSDQTLSGREEQSAWLRGNQRLTRARLLKHLQQHQPTPPTHL